jgi:hypothetical protein
MTGLTAVPDRPAQSGFLARAFAAFFAFHGIVHVIGFTVPWKLGGPRTIEYSTSLFNRSLEVGDAGVKLVGLMWLATAFAFLAVAVLLWRRHAWALRLTIALLVVSLGLCIAGLPDSIWGLAIDVALLAILAVAPDRFVPRPSTAGRPDER